MKTLLYFEILDSAKTNPDVSNCWSGRIKQILISNKQAEFPLFERCNRTGVCVHTCVYVCGPCIKHRDHNITMMHFFQSHERTSTTCLKLYIVEL